MLGGRKLYLGVRLLRVILIVQCVLTMLLGLILIIMGSVAMERPLVVELLGQWAGSVVLSFGVFIVVTAIAGFCGSHSLSRTWFFVYATALVIESIVVIVMGITVLAAGDKLVADMRNNCDDKEQFRTLQSTYNSLRLFQTDCEAQAGHFMVVNSCDKYNSRYGGDDAVTFINWLETHAHCSGFCTTAGFLYVSAADAIANGYTQDPCVSTLSYTFKSSDIGGAFLAIGLILLLTLVFPILLFRHPEREDYLKYAQGAQDDGNNNFA